LAFAYWIAPVQWTNAAPQDLREDYGAYYWEMVADSYNKSGNLDLAKRQLGTWDDPKKLQAVLARAGIESSPETKLVLDSLRTKIAPSAPEATTTPATAQKPTAQSKLTSLLLPILLAILAVAVILVIISLLVSRSRKRKTAAAVPTTTEETPEWLATMRPEPGVAALPVLGHFVTSYALGNDNYDESFSIETTAGEFLGECGVGISETIGTGSPDKVTAFEVWLFDKNDIRTVTKVVMSEHAYHDQELRATLAPKGEAVLATPNQAVVLETATLRVEATATEIIYGSGALPPNSFFERLTVELVTYQKENQVTPPGQEPQAQGDNA
jgi:heme/copper-type cytochrome/quinol oxidase subunit 2